jgi:hypothetical protein
MKLFNRFFFFFSLFLLISSNIITYPLFIWSNNNFFKEKNIQITEILQKDSLDNIIIEKLNQNLNLEIISIFIEPHIKTEYLSILSHYLKKELNISSFIHLKNIMENSNSSLFFPYIPYKEDESITNCLIEKLSKIIQKNGGSIIITGNNYENNFINKLQIQDSNILSLDNFLKKINQNWDIFHNRITDLIIIYLDNPIIEVNINNIQTFYQHFQKNDIILNQLNEKLELSKNYIGIFTSEKPFFYNFYSFENYGEIYLQNTSSNGTSINYWPPEVNEALIIMLPFLIILLIGFCCTFSIQSELKFENEKIKKQL